MRRWLQFAPVGAFAMVAATACLPSDESVERGAIYVRLSAAPLRQSVGDAHVLEFETLNVIVNGDTLSCHSLYYVDRPRPSVTLVSLLQPYVFEHRSLTDQTCGVLAGYSNPQNVKAWATDGIDPAERDLLMPEGVGSVGSLHVVAVLYRVPSAAGESLRVERRFDLVLHGLTGAAVQANGVPAPRGGMSEVYATLDMAPLAVELSNDVRWDKNRDGTVTSDELPDSVVERVRQAASDKWRFAGITIVR